MKMAELNHPLIVDFVPGGGQTQINNNKLTVPVFGYKRDTISKLNTALSNANKPYDYIALNYNALTQADKHNPKVLHAASIRSNWFMDVEQHDKILPAINRLAGSKQLYLLNPQYDKERKGFVAFPGSEQGQRFVAPISTIQSRRYSFKTQADWEKHQSDVLNKFKAQMPLSEEHKKALMAPKRGLHENELDGFFDWRSNMPVIPGLIDDNLVGIPSIKAQSFNNINVSADGIKMGTGSLLSLKTGGKSGIMIPMRNPQGATPKYQVAADVSKINCFLKAKANDGISIQKSEYYNKKSGVYNFKFQDGKPTNLKLSKTANDELTFTDAKGDFKLNMGENAKDVLKNRGYNIPEIINTLTPTKETKYIWMARGDMIGPNIPQTENISPSNPGFIEARKPPKNDNKYVVLVAEGALKGVITAKYIDTPDKNGHSLGDKIAKDHGIIVAQVPGVAKQFVKSVPSIYDGKNIVGTYIAMDADGRENKNVANGIKSAYDELKQYGPVKVMSWDPKQKGIDDSLLAIANGKITLEQMDVHFGTPEKLFPLDKAKTPIPYKLNGERAWQEDGVPAWKKEWQDDVQEQNKRYMDTTQNENSNIDLNFDGLSSKTQEVEH